MSVTHGKCNTLTFAIKNPSFYEELHKTDRIIPQNTTVHNVRQRQ